LSEQILIGLTSIAVLGVLSQWVAWRIRVPSIIILLIGGFVAGPITGFLDPDAILGDLLLPVVSLSVAIIIFEGGLNLKIENLRQLGGVIFNLITWGQAIGWGIISVAAHYTLDMSWEMSLLLGSILVVTGPTVILPLLKVLRLKNDVASVLRWEGILIDPIGAIQAVLVFEYIISASGGHELGNPFFVMGLTLVIGTLIGIVGAIFVIAILKKGWAPNYMQEALSLIMVLGVYSISNLFQTEAGLLAVAVMGIVLANQKIVVIKHIETFKENLSLILLSCLFIVLAARLEIPEMLAIITPKSLIFLGVFIFISRPVIVFLSSIRSPLNMRERTFIALVAPRGIVAAAIASLFAIKLQNLGYAEASQLVPVTFLVIIATVILYGLSAGTSAKLLGVKSPKFQGIVIASAHNWAMEIAHLLTKSGFTVLLVDANKAHIAEAKSEGLEAIQGDILSQKIQDEIKERDIGRLLAVTPNDEVNLLAAIEYSESFGKSGVYLLTPGSKSKAFQELLAKYRVGRFLFNPTATFDYITARFVSGSSIKVIVIDHDFDFKKFQEDYPKAIPLFFITMSKKLIVISKDKPINPLPGYKFYCIMSERNGE